MNDVQIVILAAGKGTRMEDEKPKVLQELAGRAFLLRILDAVEEAGLTIRPIVVVGYGKELVQKVCEDRCSFVIQEEQLGTGHAALVTEESIPKEANHVLVVYGDHPLISAETIKRLATTQSEKQPAVTMATSIVDSWDSEWRDLIYDFGRVRRDENGNFKEIIERRGASDEDLALLEVNSGYMGFRKEWGFDHLKRVGTDNAQGEYYLPDLIKFALEEQEPIELVVMPPEENIGINSKAQLEAAEKYLER